MNPQTEAANAARQSEIPPEARELADSVGRDYERRQKEAAESHERAVSRVVEEARAEIHDLLGPETLRTLRSLKRRELTALQERLQPPGGPTRNFDDENRARKSRLDRFLGERGIAPARLNEIARTHFAQARALVELDRSTLGEAIAMRFHGGVFHTWVGAEGVIADPHRFFVFEPPFDGGQTGFSVSRSPQAYRVAVNREVALDLDAGLVGHTLFLDIIDASDVDLAHGIADTQVAFWFQAPVTGLVEILIEAQSGLATHDLSVEDEWGWSDSDTRQNNFLMMHVLHPNVTAPSFAPMSDFFAATDDTNSYHHEFLTRGGDFAARLFSDGPVSANQWMVIRAGTRSDDWTMTNDMEIHSASRFQWFIKRVHVRIAP